MKLLVVDYKTSEQIDSCEVENWLEAVQYVERNKANYLDRCSAVKITGGEYGICEWELTIEPRPLILKDKLFDRSDYIKIKLK